MSNDFTAPYLTKDLPAPFSDQWQAKRDVAAAIRQLSEVLATSNASVDELEKVAQAIKEPCQSLAAADRIYGQQNFEKAGQHDQAYLELNAMGGLSNPLAPGINIWFEDKRAYGSVTCGWCHEGPPKTVHGGFVASIFDHFLGIAQFATGIVGMTAGLNVKYMKQTPLDKEVRLEAWSDRLDGRKHYLKGVIRDGDIVTAEAEALFIRPRDGIGLKGQDQASD